VALPGPQPFLIGSKNIGTSNEVFIIAEIGINHNGNMDIARKLIESAAATGADCIKFQMRNLQELYGTQNEAYNKKQDLGAQYTLDVLQRSELRDDQMFELFDLCKDLGVLPMCTPWDYSTLEKLESYGMSAYKVASADLTNHAFIKTICQTDKPLICSTGMSNEKEIVETAELLHSYSTAYAVLHCNSTYPTPFKDVNLSFLKRLKEIVNCPVGYSGHERGYAVAIAATAMGARIIEKHITLDRAMIGNDHKVSLLPHEFSEMVQMIRDVEQAMGSDGIRQSSQGELMNRETLAKSVHAKKPIVSDTIISEEDLEIKSPGKGLQPNRINELIGKKAKRNFEAGDLFFVSDLFEETIYPTEFSFPLPWGIPVRYHDIQGLLSRKVKPDFLEFHYSYQDLDLNIQQNLPEKLPFDYVVHSPDTFSGDFLLNLASFDETVRKRSIKELQRVIDTTNRLRPHFNPVEKISLIVSIGGYTKDGHLSDADVKRQYEILLSSIQKLHLDGIRLLPQTLPPFPWYFGGQLYLNLFVKTDDTIEFCKQSGLKICFDLSHTKLACSYYGNSFEETVKKFAPYTGHLHVVDAKGIDGEGVQIDEGDIDFMKICKLLAEKYSGIPFIPEIWQGHKNNGEGFWIALQRLQKYFRSFSAELVH